VILSRTMAHACAVDVYEAAESDEDFSVPVDDVSLNISGLDVRPDMSTGAVPAATAIRGPAFSAGSPETAYARVRDILAWRAR
jgi:hypothetical protein